MNQKPTRVPLPHPPQHQESLVSRGLAIVICLFLIVTGALLGYSAIDGVIHETITTATRGGPAKVYTLVEQPGAYWFHVVLQGLFGVLLLAAGLAWHRLTRLDKPAARTKRKSPSR
ncbi:hypothetical protein J3Q09_25920 [Pseudomonas sp. R4-83]|uniref:hypothetical protein n=1 Tax=unclassified Pseudomonas TaxID=196821 RepID=UPI003DA94757